MPDLRGITLVEFDASLSGVLLLGLLIGLQHALEPDHVAAVTSLASGNRSLPKILREAVAWAIGHAAMLMLVAAPALVFGFLVSDALAGWLEFIVGIMLVGLGAHVIRRLIRERIHFHAHTHDDGTTHFHAHSHAETPVREGQSWRDAHAEDPHAHEHATQVPWRALAVGLMHGLAGSAALIVLTLAQVTDVSMGLVFVAVFGVGSIVGMAALSVAIAVPLGWSAKRLTALNRSIQATVGGATIALGLFVMYETQIHGWIG